MPIEIKELHIRINVNDPQRLTGGQTNSNQSQPKEVVDVCVENVMKLLNDKKER